MMNIDQGRRSLIVASLADAVADACKGCAVRLPQTVKEILSEYTDIEEFLSPQQQMPNAAGYARHVLYGDKKGRFSILALVWSPGQRTPVHAHYTWCAYRVAAGALQEERFAWNAQTQQAILVETVQRVCGDTGHGHAGYDPVHRLGNASTRPAISIHVYGIDAERVSTHVNRLAIAA